MKISSSSQSSSLSIIQDAPSAGEFEIKEKKPWLGILGSKTQTVLTPKTGFSSLYRSFKAYFFPGYVREAREAAANKICGEIKSHYPEGTVTQFQKDYLIKNQIDDLSNIDESFNKLVKEKGITVSFVKEFLKKQETAPQKADPDQSALQAEVDAERSSVYGEEECYDWLARESDDQFETASLEAERGSTTSTDYGEIVEGEEESIEKQEGINEGSVSSPAAKKLLKEVLPMVTKLDAYKWLTNEEISESIQEQKMVNCLSSLTQPYEIMTEGVKEGSSVSFPAMGFGKTSVTPFEITLYAFVPGSSDQVKSMLQQADTNVRQLTPGCEDCTITADSRDKNKDSATYKFQPLQGKGFVFNTITQFVGKRLPNLTVNREFAPLPDDGGWSLKWKGTNSIFNSHEGEVKILEYNGSDVQGTPVKGSLIRYHARVVPSALLDNVFWLAPAAKEQVKETIRDGAATTVAALQYAK